MDSGLRRTRNSQRSNIPFKKGMPSHKSMSEGEEIMAMSYNKPLTFYRKQNGKVWEIPFIDSTKNGYLQSKNINPIDLARSPSSNDVLQTDAFGRLKWISLSAAGDIHLSAVSFSSSTGLFTSTLTNGIAKTVNLDGRYLKISDETSIDHDALTNFVAEEHIDWTVDQGSTNIHSGNYTETANLVDLEDVEDASPEDNVTIRWSGSKWEFDYVGLTMLAQPTGTGFKVGTVDSVGDMIVMGVEDSKKSLTFMSQHGPLLQERWSISVDESVDSGALVIKSAPNNKELKIHEDTGRVEMESMHLQGQTSHPTQVAGGLYFNSTDSAIYMSVSTS